jgi:uncharacterized protein
VQDRNIGRRAIPVVCVLIVATVGCGHVPDEEGYIRQVETDRSRKDRAFHESSDSPIPLHERGTFLPLAYFPVDPDYRIPAILEMAPEQIVAEMPTSTGQIRQMQQVGTLRFALKGKPLTLTAFIEAGGPLTRLFLPFADVTNGTETYAAGRYLELDRTATGLYDLDFNRAFHPYCYYDERYDCPWPPPENRLPVPVRAGERVRQ